MKSGVGLAALVAAAAFLGPPQKSFATVVSVVFIESNAADLADDFDAAQASIQANGGLTDNVSGLVDAINLSTFGSDDLIVPIVVIDRNDGNLNELTFAGVFLENSASPGLSLNADDGFVDGFVPDAYGIDYDTLAVFGHLAGPDGQVFTADDILLTDPDNSQEFDTLVFTPFQFGLDNIVGLDTVDLTDDTPDELTISIEARGGPANLLTFGSGSGSIAVTVPEPASFALLAAGSLLLTRRR